MFEYFGGITELIIPDNLKSTIQPSSLRSDEDWYLCMRMAGTFQTREGGTFRAATQSASAMDIELIQSEGLANADLLQRASIRRRCTAPGGVF
jgi:hypothetical protein